MPHAGSLSLCATDNNGTETMKLLRSLSLQLTAFKDDPSGRLHGLSLAPSGQKIDGVEQPMPDPLPPEGHALHKPIKLRGS